MILCSVFLASITVTTTASAAIGGIVRACVMKVFRTVDDLPPHVADDILRGLKKGNCAVEVKYLDDIGRVINTELRPCTQVWIDEAWDQFKGKKPNLCNIQDIVGY